MKLRSKLVLLVVGTSLLFLLSVSAYFVILAPLDKMEKETETFQELSRSTASLQVEVNLLLVKPMGAQTEAFKAAVARFKAAQEGVQKVTLLPSINEEVAQAVQSTFALGELSATGLDSVLNSLSELKEFTKDSNTNFDASDWAQLMRAAATPGSPNAGVANYMLANLVNNLSLVNESLAVTRQIIDQKDAAIAQEVSALKGRSTLYGLAIILLSVGSAVVVSFFLARNITRAISTLGGTVARVGGGDLRLRFGSVRKDELGVLGRDIDALLDSLTAAFRRIQAASAENLAVKDQLVQSVSSATSSAVEIEANSSSILGQLKKVDDRIQASEADLNGVVILLEAFHIRLGSQNQSVADATRAVAELAQGIARINGLSDENRRAVEALLAQSDRGREVFDHSFAKVAEITDSVAAIQDLVGAIAEIAGQTNILALNAAIEAAHAGEAGKGFAVVADEISKLAAASAASSAQIAVTIKEVVGKIREAGATREETLGAFDAIGVQIATVSDRSRGIDAEATQMNQGTHKIRQVMDGLAASSDEITREADRIGTVATKLGDALGQVGRISHEVVSNIDEITEGLAEISRTVGEVSGQADRLGRVGAALDHAVNAFQTETETPSEVVAQPGLEDQPVQASA